MLLVACGIGLCTGGGVVLFNWAIHAIQEIAWGPVLLSQVCYKKLWARTASNDSCACLKLLEETSHTAGRGVGAQHAKGWPVAADHCAASHR